MLLALLCAASSHSLQARVRGLEQQAQVLVAQQENMQKRLTEQCARLTLGAGADASSGGPNEAALGAHDWHLQQAFSAPKANVNLMDFRVSAAGSDATARSYGIAVRGAYRDVVTLIETVLTDDAALALTAFACGATPNVAERVDCTLSLQRAGKGVVR